MMFRQFFKTFNRKDREDRKEERKRELLLSLVARTTPIARSANYSYRS
jgi:hypothetical protein